MHSDKGITMARFSLNGMIVSEEIWKVMNYIISHKRLQRDFREIHKNMKSKTWMLIFIIYVKGKTYMLYRSYKRHNLVISRVKFLFQCLKKSTEIIELV